jgi:hypothetical protein
MSKLYPPSVEGTIPAFYDNERLKVPFAMNRAVSANDVNGMVLKLKSVYNNALLVANEYAKEVKCD